MPLKGRIAVVGPRTRPAAACTAAGAMLNCFGEVTAGTARHPAARAKFSIARDALDRWPPWLEVLADITGSPGEVLRATAGTTVVLSGRSGRVAAQNFEAMRAALVEHGEPHDVLDPFDVEGLAPELGARPFHAVQLCREGTLDARAQVETLEPPADSGSPSSMAVPGHWPLATLTLDRLLRRAAAARPPAPGAAGPRRGTARSPRPARRSAGSPPTTWRYLSGPARRRSRRPRGFRRAGG